MHPVPRQHRPANLRAAVDAPSASGAIRALAPAACRQGMGRNKQEAEQSCARQALAHIRAAAPQLGVPEVPPPPHFPPASPYTLSTLFSSAEAASSHLAAGSSAAGSVDGHGHMRSTPGGTSSTASAAAAPGSPPQAADAAAAPSPAPAPSSRSAAASDADLDGMETDELRRALRQALARNVELAARVARLEASADAERRCLQGVKQAIDEALRGLEL